MITLVKVLFWVPAITLAVSTVHLMNWNRGRFHLVILTLPAIYFIWEVFNYNYFEPDSVFVEELSGLVLSLLIVILYLVRLNEGRQVLLIACVAFYSHCNYSTTVKGDQMSTGEAILLDTLRCRLNFLRTGRSLSQVVISSALSISLFKYHKYEEEEGIPSVIGLIYIADFYGISVDYLASRSETTSKLK